MLERGAFLALVGWACLAPTAAQAQTATAQSQAPAQTETAQTATAQSQAPAQPSSITPAQATVTAAAPASDADSESLDLSEETSFDDELEVHGFVSQGLIKSTRNNYLARSKGAGSLEFSEIGLNLTKPLSDRLRLGAQLFAHDLGPIGNYAPQLDWYYLDYRWRDELGLRVGRLKVPFGLYNELNDIDVARLPVLLPQSIYPVDHREFLFAQTGAELYGRVSLAQAGDLEYRAYGGTITLEPGPQEPSVTVTRLDVPYLLGGRAMWDTPFDGLRAGLSLQFLRLDTQYGLSPELQAALIAFTVLPADYTNPLKTKFRVTRWVGSVNYTGHDFDLTAEYSRWLGAFESDAPLLFPPHTVNERYYAMAGYRMTPWFMPGIYYSALYTNLHQRSGHHMYQHDVAVTARYDLTANWLLKLEAHYLRGTAALDNSRRLNDNATLAALNPFWTLFLLKTTAYF